MRTIAEPLRLRLNVPPLKQHQQQLRQLEQLPQPLHTAYLQLRAAQEAFGLPAEISISGVCTCGNPVFSKSQGLTRLAGMPSCSHEAGACLPTQ